MMLQRMIMSPPEFPANLRLMICIPCLLVGGTEVHTINLARAMQVAGADVTVCCYYEHDPITVNALRRLGVAVELLGLDRQSGGSAGRGLLRGVALAKALTDCIHRLRPDVVHVQYMAPGALPLIIARAAGVPYVVATVHVTANHYGRRSWLPRKVGAPLCDAFLCVSGVAEHSFFGRSSFFTEAGWREGRRHFRRRTRGVLASFGRARLRPRRAAGDRHRGTTRPLQGT